MQFIESSIIGVRSAVFTLKRRTTPLRFTLFPMVHVAEQSFYDAVASRAARCDLIVAEGVPSGHATAQSWMARIRADHLVDQLVGLDLEPLGVPVQWEHTIGDRRRSNRELAVERLLDSAAALGLRAFGRYGNPLKLDNLDEADENDDRWTRREGGRISRFLDDKVVRERDEELLRALSTIHRRRYTEPITVAVVYGAAHMPCAVEGLRESFGYYVDTAEWLTIANAPS